MAEISTSAVGVNNTKSESCYSNGVRNYVDMVATFFHLKSDDITRLPLINGAKFKVSINPKMLQCLYIFSENL